MRLASSVAATAGLTVAALASAVPVALASAQRPYDGPSVVISNPDVSVTPNPSAPGTATTFVVSCTALTAGGTATSATLNGSSLGLSSQIAMQPGAQPGQFVVTVTLPQTIGAGSFSPVITCDNGVSQTATFEVNAIPSQAPATGDGSTSAATDGKLAVAGLGLLGIAAVAGAVVLRRRRSGRHI